MRPCPAAVRRAKPRQCQRLQSRVPVQDCLAILDAQNVVGRAQQAAGAGVQRVGSRGPGGGIGHADGKILADAGVQFLPVQQAGRVQQSRRVGGLCTEGQRITAKRGQQVHARGGELLRRGAGVGRGQGYHKVSPGIQRRAYPHALGQNRHTAALHRAAAHADGNTLCPCGAHGSQLGRMAVVEGVVFGNNACEIHNNWLLILWR